MTRFITHSLWVRQTAYTVLVIAAIAIAVAGFDMVSKYNDENTRLQQFANHLIDSFYDATARAAFHVDPLQADSVIEGMMQFEELQLVSIRTDLGTALATRERTTDSAATDRLAIWLFSEMVSYDRELVVDRSDFVTGQQHSSGGATVVVGHIRITLDPTVIGGSFVTSVRRRSFELIIEFLILGAALGFIFYMTTTKPLVEVADRLGDINPHGMELERLRHSKSHRHDEFGLVVDRINDLLGKIDEQKANLIHREKIAALGSMLAEVAHELNNPLAVVTAQAELLAETATDDKTRNRAEKILRPARRSADIVRKFLSLARQRQVEKEVLNVDELINESLDMLKYQLDKRSIAVNFEIDPGAAKVWGDKANLGQVVVNIIVNAQQALTRMDGEKNIGIGVRVDDVAEKITISFADNGPGISPEIRDKVFDHFFTTKPEGRGTGLGLAFCKSVVEDHGGTIVVNAVEPRGTNLVITLPRTRKVRESVRLNPKADDFPKALKVLVVDDEETLATSIAESLSRSGHQPSTAFSCEQALLRLVDTDFDVILADVHMPGGDGLEFYRRVFANDERMAKRFVFVTGDSLDPRLAQFFEEERRPHINKPFELSDLVSIVEGVYYESEEAASVGPAPGVQTGA